ncbi:MAG: hypothetical protein AAGA08_03120 [Pseudomonadota bacterium]
MGGLKTALKIGAALLVMSSAAAVARDLTLVTQRHADWTEVYISAGAPDLFDTFSVPYQTLTGETDQVDFGELRAGTGWLGDVLLEQATITIGPRDAALEGMSLMVHPADSKLPMTTPLEGMIAIGVCNGPPDGTYLSISELHAYVGYFSDIGSDGLPISLSFKQPLTSATRVTVYDHGADGAVTRYSLELQPGDPLLLPADPVSDTQLSTLMPVAGVLGMVGALTVLMGVKTRPGRT